MHVLVVGGAGYIGSITVAELLAAGHRVSVYDSLVHGHREAIDPRARFLRGSLQDLGALSVAFDAETVDAVIHFAAFIEVGESMLDPGRYFANNVGGSVNLVNTMLAHGVRRLVFSSTAAVYGPPLSIPIDEQHPLAPINVYGQSKLMVEQMLAWYASQAGLRYVALRYFNAAGASATLGEDHEPETHLIPNLLTTALGRKTSVAIFGDDYPTPDGTCMRDDIHVLDLAQAHALALERTASASGVYNLGSGEGFSVNEVLRAARQISEQPIPAEVQPRRPGDPPVLVASSELARRELGWRPAHSAIDAIVASAWQWRAAHPDGYEPLADRG
jgi:UDP-glucose 4-epimerase